MSLLFSCLSNGNKSLFFLMQPLSSLYFPLISVKPDGLAATEDSNQPFQFRVSQLLYCLLFYFMHHFSTFIFSLNWFFQPSCPDYIISPASRFPSYEPFKHTCRHDKASRPLRLSNPISLVNIIIFFPSRLYSSFQDPLFSVNKKIIPESCGGKTRQMRHDRAEGVVVSL